VRIERRDASAALAQCVKEAVVAIPFSVRREVADLVLGL
jgi:hypothetical protein